MGSVNDGGERPTFKRGEDILADKLNKALDSIPARFVGAGPVKVTTAARVVTIGIGEDGYIEPAPDRVIAIIGEHQGGGVYAWTLARGAGPDEGTAEEISFAEDVAPGTVVYLFRHGVWTFTRSAPAGDSGGGAITGKITGGGSGSVYNFVEVNPYGGGVVSGGITGTAFESNGTTLSLNNLILPIFHSDGGYWFSYPVEECL